MIDHIQTDVPEIMKLSKDSKFLFLAEGTRGFIIYDVSNPEKLS